MASFIRNLDQATGDLADFFVAMVIAAPVILFLVGAFTFWLLFYH